MEEFSLHSDEQIKINNGAAARRSGCLKTEPDAKWFRRLLENLPAGAYTCDAEGLITYINQRAVEVWGRTKPADPAELMLVIANLAGM